MEDGYIVALVIGVVQVIPLTAHAILQWWNTREGRREERSRAVDAHQFARLHRAHKLVRLLHLASIETIDSKMYDLDRGPNEQNLAFDAEHAANNAELRGLAHAIGDKELLGLVCKISRFIGAPDEGRGYWSFTAEKMDTGSWAQLMYICILQLLENAAAGKYSGKT